MGRGLPSAAGRRQREQFAAGHMTNHRGRAARACLWTSLPRAASSLYAVTAHMLGDAKSLPAQPALERLPTVACRSTSRAGLPSGVRMPRPGISWQHRRHAPHLDPGTPSLWSGPALAQHSQQSRWGRSGCDGQAEKGGAFCTARMRRQCSRFTTATSTDPCRMHRSLPHAQSPSFGQGTAWRFLPHK